MDEMVSERIFDYDLDLYDRRFLNCFQRHAAVCLAQVHIPVPLLFHRALIPADVIMQQMLFENQPKYAFVSDFFLDADLAILGVEILHTEADAFSEIEAPLYDAIGRNGFAWIAGDVFHFPHCPEYRTSHADHVICLRGHNAGRWQVVDDNKASVLCHYEYTTNEVAAFFEHTGWRFLRHPHFSPIREDAADIIRGQFTELLTAYDTGTVFYDEIMQLLENPWSTLKVKLRALHDCFALLSGTRVALAAYLDLAAPAGAPLARAFSETALVLKGLSARAQITGKVRLADMVTRCQTLRLQDAGLTEILKRQLLV